MKGTRRTIVVAAALTLGAGVVMVARAAPPDPLVYGTQRVVEAAEWAAHAVTDYVAGLLKTDGMSVAANVAERSSVRPAQQGDEFTWTGRVNAGDAVEIKGVNGPVHAEATTGDRVEVRAVKRGRRSDPSEVRIEVLEHAGGVTLCAVYPSARGRPNECAPGNDGHMSVRDNDVHVTFYVKVPAGVEFRGKTVNGDVEAVELASNAFLTTVNGDVSVSTTGYAEAETVNGSIEASLGAADPAEGLRFRTVNGGIVLDLPDDVNVDVDATWVNGGIRTELPLQLTGRITRRSARGVLGRGGPRLDLSTVNGSIRIR